VLSAYGAARASRRSKAMRREVPCPSTAMPHEDEPGAAAFSPASRPGAAAPARHTRPWSAPRMHPKRDRPPPPPLADSSPAGKLPDCLSDVGAERPLVLPTRAGVDAAAAAVAAGAVAAAGVAAAAAAGSAAAAAGDAAATWNAVAAARLDAEIAAAPLRDDALSVSDCATRAAAGP